MIADLEFLGLTEDQGLRNLMFFAHLGDRIRPKPFDKAGRGRGLGQVRLLRDRLQEGRREDGVQGDLGGEEPTANGNRRGASPIKSPRSRDNAMGEK